MTKEIQELAGQIDSYDALGLSEDDEAAIAVASRRLEAHVEAMVPPRERPKAGRRRRGTQRRASPRVFLSYRRTDSAPYAGRLHDALSDRFGSDSVFRGINEPVPGARFEQAISGAAGGSDVVLVLIGPRWLSASSDTGERRIDDPHDYVRLEIEAALASNTTVLIPILVEGASMPSPMKLPESLQGLGYRSALELDDARWSYDVERLIAAIEKLAGD